MAIADSPSRSAAVAQPLALAFAAFLALVLLVFVGITFFGNAEDGEPMASVPLNITHPNSTPAARASVETPAPQPTAPEPVPQNVIRVTAPIYAGSALLADPALIEQTAAGPLPRIADDGRTPMQAYAPAMAATGKPRIAIVISGLSGGSKAATAAIEQTPAAITLAIVGNTADPQKLVADAREHGHEVLLQIPMEPYDYPDSDPGPNTLRADAPEDQNIDRLTVMLVHATGYAGIVNLQGSRVLANSAALSPVLTFAARRGLLFFAIPAGSPSPRTIAEQQKTTYAESFTTLDADPSPAAIDRQLSEVETQARANGAAAASASAYPVTLARIKNWAKSLSGRGFVLVPASAIVTQSK